MSEARLLRLGSRTSPLARTQTEWVASQLPGATALVWIKSEGDRDRATELSGFGGVGVFTAVLHRALLADRIDVAVHSLKDLPAGREDGIHLACVPRREDPRDVLVSRGDVRLDQLPRGARIGTGSPRRAAQLARHRPDLVFAPLRGNVDTRLRKLKEGQFDATLLALAGLRRLGKEHVATEILATDVCLPAAGQGALGLTIREGDGTSEEALGGLRDVEAAACTMAERAALHALGAGCHAPVGALARLHEGQVELRVRVLSPDGAKEIAGTERGPLAGAKALGERLAARLLEEGAGPLVRTS